MSAEDFDRVEDALRTLGSLGVNVGHALSSRHDREALDEEQAEGLNALARIKAEHAYCAEASGAARDAVVAAVRQRDSWRKEAEHEKEMREKAEAALDNLKTALHETQESLLRVWTPRTTEAERKVGVLSEKVLRTEAERDALRDDKAELEHLHRVNREECVALRSDLVVEKERVRQYEAHCPRQEEQIAALRAEVERLRALYDAAREVRDAVHGNTVTAIAHARREERLRVAAYVERHCYEGTDTAKRIRALGDS